MLNEYIVFIIINEKRQIIDKISLDELMMKK